MEKEGPPAKKGAFAILVLHVEGLSRGLEAWAQAHGRAPWLVPGAQHCKGPGLLGDPYADRLAAFLREAVQGAQIGAQPAPGS